MTFVEGYAEVMNPMKSLPLDVIVKTVEGFHETSAKYLQGLSEIKYFLSSDNWQEKGQLAELLDKIDKKHEISISYKIGRKIWESIEIASEIKGTTHTEVNDTLASYMVKKRKKVLPVIDDMITEILTARTDVNYKAFAELARRLI